MRVGFELSISNKHGNVSLHHIFSLPNPVASGLRLNVVLRIPVGIEDDTNVCKV